MNKIEFLHMPILRIRDYHISNSIFIGQEYHYGTCLVDCSLSYKSAPTDNLTGPV